MIRFDIITIFPEGIAPLLHVGVLGAAQDSGYIEVRCHDLRDYTDDPHCVVDDRAYGGGPGMVMKVEPFVRAIESIAVAPADRRRIVLMSSQGRLLRQADARTWSELDQLVLLCGRYQGVDERLIAYVDDEISIGDFVIAGGESAAAVVVEATARMAPGVVGQFQSVEGDSFFDGPRLGAPHYTRPAEFRGASVPDVLLNGDHAKIERARQRWAWEKTAKNRPDLLGLVPGAGGEKPATGDGPVEVELTRRSASGDDHLESVSGDG